MQILPGLFGHIHMKFLASGRGLTEKNLRQAIVLSEGKYCSVAATIRGVAKITWDFEILPEGYRRIFLYNSFETSVNNS